MSAEQSRDPISIGFAHTIQAGLDETLAADGVASPSNAGTNPFAHGEARYEITGTIGQGGMGRVLEANDRQFGRVVALKELIGEASSVSVIQRFVIESLVTGNLEHPGIPAVYERGVREGRPFYTMRRLRGRTLAEALADAPRLPDRLKLLPIVVQVANTLGFAHERGVVHRDIKPDNIIVGRHGETVVLDWGIAKVRSLESSVDSPDAPLPEGTTAASPLTVHGAVLGTPSYMAPEQAAGRIDEIDERTDVFALGAILYQLLSGSPPYRGPTLAATLTNALEGRRESLDRVAPGAPPALRAICEKAMAQSPADRYRSASELVDALEHFQTNAVLGSESKAIGLIANLSSALVVVILVIAAIMIARLNPTLREQGSGAIGITIIAVFGVALSLIEWRTRGRYALSALSASLAATTVLVGLANAFSGIEVMLRFAQRPAIFEDGHQFRELITAGLFESLGNISTSSILAAIQVVVLAIAYRAVKRAKLGVASTAAAARQK